MLSDVKKMDLIETRFNDATYNLAVNGMTFPQIRTYLTHQDNILSLMKEFQVSEYFVMMCFKQSCQDLMTKKFAIYIACDRVGTTRWLNATTRNEAQRIFGETIPYSYVKDQRLQYRKDNGIKDENCSTYETQKGRDMPLMAV